VDTSTIYEGEADPFDQPVLDHKDRKVTPPDLRSERPLALCEELLKPKYAVNGFKLIFLTFFLNKAYFSKRLRSFQVEKINPDWYRIDGSEKKLEKWVDL